MSPEDVDANDRKAAGVIRVHDMRILKDRFLVAAVATRRMQIETHLGERETPASWGGELSDTVRRDIHVCVNALVIF